MRNVRSTLSHNSWGIFGDFRAKMAHSGRRYSVRRQLRAESSTWGKNVRIARQLARGGGSGHKAPGLLQQQKGRKPREPGGKRIEKRKNQQKVSLWR